LLSTFFHSKKVIKKIIVITPIIFERKNNSYTFGATVLRNNLHIRFLAILLLLFAFSANTLALYSYNHAAPIESGYFLQATPANDDEAGKTCPGKKFTLLYTTGTSIRIQHTLPVNHDAIKILQRERSEPNRIQKLLMCADFFVSVVLLPCFLVVCQHFRI